MSNLKTNQEQARTKTTPPPKTPTKNDDVEKRGGNWGGNWGVVG